MHAQQTKSDATTKRSKRSGVATTSPRTGNTKRQREGGLSRGQQGRTAHASPRRPPPSLAYHASTAHNTLFPLWLTRRLPLSNLKTTELMLRSATILHNISGTVLYLNDNYRLTSYSIKKLFPVCK
jgi:hypothetical protein